MTSATMQPPSAARQKAISPAQSLLKEVLTELLIGPPGGTSLFTMLGIGSVPKVPYVKGVAWSMGAENRPELHVFAEDGSQSLEQLAERLREAGIPTSTRTGIRFTAAARPCLGGGSIGSATSGRSGTMGCVVVSRSDGTRFALTCNHVVADLNAATPGSSEVWAPGASDGGTAAHRLGVVEDFSVLDFSPAAHNDIDAAIVRPDRPADLDPRVRGIGRPSGAGAPPSFRDPVRTSGFISGPTSGTYFYDINALVDFDDGSTALFRNLLGIVGTAGQFATQGDSGAAVFDGNGGVVGMVVSVGMDLALACRIQPVLSRFGVDIAT